MEMEEGQSDLVREIVRRSHRERKTHIKERFDEEEEERVPEKGVEINVVVVISGMHR